MNKKNPDKCFHNLALLNQINEKLPIQTKKGSKNTFYYEHLLLITTTTGILPETSM
jgi:hypothetical protein